MLRQRPLPRALPQLNSKKETVLSSRQGDIQCSTKRIHNILFFFFDCVVENIYACDLPKWFHVFFASCSCFKHIDIYIFIYRYRYRYRYICIYICIYIYIYIYIYIHIYIYTQIHVSVRVRLCLCVCVACVCVACVCVLCVYVSVCVCLRNATSGETLVEYRY